MTETATAATVSTLEHHKLRHRRRARCPASRSGSPRTARCCSTARTSSRATTATTTRRSARSSTAGCTRATSAARRGRLPLDHRPQEGHHHHRGRQEPHAGQPRERPQAVALDLPGRDARRPPALPGGAGHARPGGDRRLRARARAARRTSPRWRSEPKVRELIQGVLDEANAKYAQVEQIKRFAILDHDLSQETGELTPTLKVKRNVVYEKYARRARRAATRADPPRRALRHPPRTGAAARRSSARGSAARRASSPSRRRSGARPCARAWRRSRCRGAAQTSRSSS